jgi:MFS family permease
MGKISKAIAVYMCLMLVLSTYTFISAFYPQIAKDHGIPIWVIGVVFSLNPASSLISALILGKNMNIIGRKKILLGSLLFTSISMFLLSPIEYLDTNYILIMSFTSRIISGVGSACVFTSVTTIFVSDYPDEVQIMLGRMEAAIGVGLILGPLIGTVLYSINLLVAMNVMGISILLFFPISSKMLGELREYKISDKKISSFRLFFKPVFFT